MEALDLMVMVGAVAIAVGAVVERRRRRKRMNGLEPQPGRASESEQPKTYGVPGPQDQRHAGYFGP